MLLEATEQGRVFMVKYLLDSGDVDVNETDRQGQNALIKACLLEDHVAATRRRLTRLLLSKGANVGNIDVFGRNVLMWACLLGKVDVVKILFAHSLMDLDFNCIDLNGDTALHYVASAGRSGLVAMLVKAMKRFGLSVDKRNNQGITPLFAATKNGKETCARMLLNQGASPNIMDPETLTNTKELAENQNLTSLVELISTISPSTRSRRAQFRSKPDDDKDIASGMPLKPRTLSAESDGSSTQNGSVFSASLKYSVTIQDLNSPRNQSFSGNSCQEGKTFLDVAERKRRKTFSEWSLKERFSEISSQGKRDVLLKTAPAGLARRTPVSQVSKVVECRTPHSNKRVTVRPVTSGAGTNEHSRKNCEVLKDPYDVRELKDLLSLYGEQNSSTFRTGFSTPVMTEKQFQKSLKMISSPPDIQVPPPMRLYSSRRSSSSTISSNGRCPVVAQGHNVFLKDRKHIVMNDTCPVRRRTSSTKSLKEFKRISLKLTRNISGHGAWNWRDRARRGSCPSDLLLGEAKETKLPIK